MEDPRQRARSKPRVVQLALLLLLLLMTAAAFYYCCFFNHVGGDHVWIGVVDNNESNRNSSSKIESSDRENLILRRTPESSRTTIHRRLEAAAFDENSNTATHITTQQRSSRRTNTAADDDDNDALLRINCGGPSQTTDTLGHEWQGDAPFLASGGWFNIPCFFWNAWFVPNGLIYKTMRTRWEFWGLLGHRPLQYEIDGSSNNDNNDGTQLPSEQPVTAVLHFTERGFNFWLWLWGDTAKVNVLVQGQTVFENLELVAGNHQNHNGNGDTNEKPSGTITVETTGTTSEDGTLTIEIQSTNIDPTLSAVEIYYTGDSLPPSVSPTNTSPTPAPVMQPTGGPSTPTAAPPTKAPTNPNPPPVKPPTNPPVQPPTEPPVPNPNPPPVKPPTNPPVKPPTNPPVQPPTEPPVPQPTPWVDGAWIEVDSSADLVARHEACFVFDDVSRKAYLIGGRYRQDNRINIYDPVSQSWSAGAAPPIELHHMQCVAADGKIWIVSSWTGSYPREQNTEDIHIYDPVMNAWSTRAGLPEPRRRGSAASVLVGRRIFVSHGNRGGHEQGDGDYATTLGWLDYYDLDKDEWTTGLPDAPNPRDHTGGALINGNKLCIAGGRDGGTDGFFNLVILPTDCYNLDKGEWTVEADIPQGRAGSSYGTTCDKKLMIAGGEGFGKAFSEVYVFNGSSWASFPDLNVARHGSGLAVDCKCKQIHIASGSGGQGGGPELQSVETFFPNGEDTSCPS